MYLLFFPQATGKSLYYACLPRVYNCLLDETSSIVVVATPLTNNEKSGALIKKNIVHVFRVFSNYNCIPSAQVLNVAVPDPRATRAGRLRRTRLTEDD